jgi:colanic acid/amylovoran biosynthesis glycosyltransferase
MRKIKILSVIPSFVLPSEVWMYRQLQHFARNDLRVIAYQDLKSPEFPLPTATVVVVPSESSKPLRGWRRTWDRLTTPNLAGPRFGIAHRRWLRDQIESFAPDLIHCQYGTYGLSTLYVAKPLGIPVFVQFNGHDLSCFIKRKRTRDQLIRSLNDFAGLVTVANYQRDWLLQHGADKDRVAMIPYGAPREPHVSREVRVDRPCRFIMVGRLCEMKSPLQTILAFHQCVAVYPDCQLTIIGDGDLRNEVSDLVNQLNLEDKVRLLGVQPPQVVRSEMLNADVFVQHSVTATNGTKEGWPVAIGEAMQRSLPIVSTRHAGILQQVISGVNGWLCNEHDWVTMAEQMIDLATHPKRRAEMGKRSSQLALDSEVQCSLQVEFMRQRCGFIIANRPSIAA